jgi:hypothetical protein
LFEFLQEAERTKAMSVGASFEGCRVRRVVTVGIDIKLTIEKFVRSHSAAVTSHVTTQPCLVVCPAFKADLDSRCALQCASDVSESTGVHTPATCCAGSNGS